MAKYDVPRDDSNNTAPLTVRRIKRATLDKVMAFTTVDDVKDEKGRVTGTQTSAKLALYWNSGFIQRNADGDPIYDEDGEEQTHYIVDGFVRVSQHPKSNLVKNILPALGFEGEEFFIIEGKREGYLRDGLFDFEFGENALGDDYADITNLLDLPMYERNGKHRKGEVECEVLSFKIGEHELIGRAVELELEVKDGWNRIKNYMLPEDFTTLDEETPEARSKARRQAAEQKQAPSKGRGKAKAPAPSEEADEADAEEDPRQQKAAAYVKGMLKKSKIPPADYGRTLAYMLGVHGEVDPDEISLKDAGKFRTLVEGEGGLDIIKDAHANAADEFPSEEDLPW